MSLLDEILGKLNGLPQDAQKEIIDQATRATAHMPWLRVCLSEAAEMAGIPYKSVKSRIRKGWTVDEALGCPIDRRKQECSIKSLSG